MKHSTMKSQTTGLSGRILRGIRAGAKLRAGFINNRSHGCPLHSEGERAEGTAHRSSIYPTSLPGAAVAEEVLDHSGLAAG